MKEKIIIASLLRIQNDKEKGFSNRRINSKIVKKSSFFPKSPKNREKRRCFTGNFPEVSRVPF